VQILAWTIEYGPSARRDLKQLPKDYASSVIDFVEDELEVIDDPRILGRQLKGYSDIWRFRVGQHRIVGAANADEELLTLWVIQHRREVYKTARRRL